MLKQKKNAFEYIQNFFVVMGQKSIVQGDRLIC